MFWRKTVAQKPCEPTAYYDRLPTYAAGEIDRMSEAMHVDGFVLVPGVIGPTQIERARTKIDALQKQGWDFTGATDHYKNVFNRDPFWLSFLDCDGVIDLMELVLGDDCHIIGETAWRSHPGQNGVGLHLDYLPMEWPAQGIPDDVRVPMFLCTAHFYLGDVTIDLCPTQVIPGSHRAGRKPTRLEYDWNGRLLQPVVCKAGDVLIFRSDLWHSGSRNRTPDRVRYLLQVHYGRREMAQHFSPYLDWHYNTEVVASCNERQLRLLGNHRQGAYD